MSIAAALRSSVTGLKAAEEQLSVASGNIANAGTPGYVRQRALLAADVTEGRITGVSVLGIGAEINESLAAEIRRQSADLSQQNTLMDFYTRITPLYGSPGQSNSVADRADAFFTAAQKLSDNPEELALRRNVADQGANLARQLAGAADNLQKLRFETDQQLGEAFDNVNDLLSRIHTVNQKIVGFRPLDPSYENYRVEQDRALRELSEYFPVTYNRGANGAVSVSGPGGSVLLESQLYEVDYTPLLTQDAVNQGDPFGAALVKAAGSDDKRIPPFTLISGGETGQSLITRGKVRALLDMRDTVLPELNAQLDTLAATVRETVNAVHNDGAAYPPPSVLTGERSFTYDSALNFSGSVRIAALTETGEPISSPYGDQTRTAPLTLNLGALNGGEGDGKFTVKQVIGEINDYFAPRAMTTLGNVRDIRLKLKDDNLADGGSASFALEYENLSAFGASVKVKNVSVTDPVDASAGYTAVTVPSSAESLGAGERKESAGRFTVSFAGDDNRTQYNVNVTVEVTDDQGNVSEAVLTYAVNDALTDARNTRFAAEGISLTSGTGTREAAPSVSAPVRAVLRDAAGNVAAEGEEGTLSIEGRGSAVRVALAELNGAFQSSGPSHPDKGKGFSHYFALNNFFTEVPPEAKGGDARHFAVRSDISGNPSLFSTGSLTLSAQPSDPDQAAYTYELGAANNGGARALAAAGARSVKFGATEAFSATYASISGYSASLTEYVSGLSSATENNQGLEQYAFDQLQKQNLQETGVDADAELAKVLEIEAQYTASATLIGTLRSMMQTLNQALA